MPHNLFSTRVDNITRGVTCPTGPEKQKGRAELRGRRRAAPAAALQSGRSWPGHGPARPPPRQPPPTTPAPMRGRYSETLRTTVSGPTTSDDSTPSAPCPSPWPPQRAAKPQPTAGGSLRNPPKVVTGTRSAAALTCGGAITRQPYSITYDMVAGPCSGAAHR